VRKLLLINRNSLKAIFSLFLGCYKHLFADNSYKKPGVRKLPSALNLAMMNAINSGIGNQKSAIEGITVPLIAGALIAINNGDFSTNTDWDICTD
jgi:hypothetical protein